MNAPADTAFLAKERARAKWVALAAALAILCFIAASLIAGPALSDVRSGSSADLLVAYHDDSSRAVVIPSLLRALSFLLMGVPLLYLFQAARAREPRVRREFLGFYILGPALIAAQFVLLSTALVDVGDDFVAQAETVAESPSDDPDADVDEDSPRENLADDLLQDSSAVSTAQVISLVGFLCFGIALFYTGLWSMRTGLLSRFNATFAMALGVVCAIPFFSQLGAFGAVIWMAFLAVFFARSPERRPPAWTEGRAVPWPKPGEAPAEGGTVEGSGREVSERGLPEAEPNPGEPAGGADAEEPPARGETQGQRRRKRKRRD
jgi:hypothetical protein